MNYTLSGFLSRINKEGIENFYTQLITQIKTEHPKYNALIKFDEDFVWQQIKAKHYQGKLLGGVPIIIKDNIHVQGLKSTCGSRILENYFPPFQATLVNHLIENGAIILGKANMDEFACGIDNTTSYFGCTANPIYSDYVPGGSSGGSATVVGRGYVPFSVGTDTGGSVRLPSSFCGLVGLKPTYGRISRYGVASMSMSLDQPGPIAHTVEDVSQLYNIMQGKDDADAVTINEDKIDFQQDIASYPSATKKVGILNFFENNQEIFDPEIIHAVEMLKSFLKSQNIEVIDIKVPYAEYLTNIYTIISRCELYSALAPIDGVRYGRRAKAASIQEMYRNNRSEGFGNEIKDRLAIGAFITLHSEYYTKALKLRRFLLTFVEDSLKNVDLLMNPTTLTFPWKIGQEPNSQQINFSDRLVVLSNLTGVPSLNIPLTQNQEGFYSSILLIGGLMEEKKILQFGHFIEQNFHRIGS